MTVQPYDTRPGDVQVAIERARPWLVQCGSCDAALPMDCTCPAGDPRSVIAALVDALEQAFGGAT